MPAEHNHCRVVQVAQGLVGRLRPGAHGWESLPPNASDDSDRQAIERTSASLPCRVPRRTHS